MAEIRQVGVVGVGIMGPGIAQAFAQAGYPVRLQHRSQEGLRRGFDAIERSLRVLTRHGLLAPGEEEQTLARIHGVTELDDLATGADLIIEAAPEKLATKQALFSTLDGFCGPETILASNTSGLSITQMASATRRPERVVGMHFWNPPHLLPLVEVVRGEKTSESTLTLACQVLSAIGKKPVRVLKEVPGFVGTRLHQALIREAFHIVEQGIASLEDVDTVVKTSFGRRLAVTGPFETCDLGGLDTFLSAAAMWRDLGTAAEPAELLRRRAGAGELGTKSGRGLYPWDADAAARLLRQREEVLIYFLKRDGRPETKPQPQEDSE